MKLRPLAVLATLLFWTGCSGDKTPEMVDAGPVDSGVAPDPCADGMECLLTPDMMMSEVIGTPGDQDPYVFDVSAAGKVINILVTNDADFSPVRLEVVMFGPDGAALTNQRGADRGKQRVELQLIAPAAGRFRVVVRDVANDDEDRNSPYFITLRLLDDADANEPNDSAQNATALTPGTGVTGVIGVEGDEDWYRFNVAASQLIQVAMSVTGDSPVRLKWELWTGDGNTRIAESLEPNDGTPWGVENRAVGNAAGEYLLRVIDDDGQQADLDRPYSLTVSFIAEPDAQDLAAPNETFDQATAATSGQNYTGYIAATSDKDFFSINVAQAPQLIRVEANMSGLSSANLAIVVLAPDGETEICDMRDDDLCKAFRFVRDGDENVARLRTAHVATMPGTYYVVVRDLQDRLYDTNASYQLRIDLPAEPDAGENYDLMGRDGARVITSVTGTAATTIQYPWVEGYISHANDQDWFRFDIPGPIAAPPGQNGDWLVQLELEMPAPTPVELEAFFFGTGRSYGGYGQRCRDPMQDPDPCQFPDSDNGINATFGESNGDCFVVFREITEQGPHFFRLTDLDRDDFDLAGRYRFRVTLTAGCPVPGACEGVFEMGGQDLCGRP